MHQYRQNSGPSSLDSGRMPEAGSDEEGRNDEPHHRGADRNCRESAEAVGTLLDKLCRQFVHAAGKVASGGIIAHKDAWRADGGYRNVDPGVIHVR
jgi:hypothetical protein